MEEQDNELNVPEIDSKYRKILIAAKRSKQIQKGALARVRMTNSIKPTRVALEEVDALELAHGGGALSWVAGVALCRERPARALPPHEASRGRAGAAVEARDGSPLRKRGQTGRSGARSRRPRARNPRPLASYFPRPRCASHARHGSGLRPRSWPDA